MKINMNFFKYSNYLILNCQQNIHMEQDAILKKLSTQPTINSQDLIK